jgi:preprotein translocase subunit SecF
VKGSFQDVVNLSINQTLSRTVVTSLTTLMSILVVLGFNFGTGNALEGFMLALAVGMISGTYSTIFIACPLLVWFEERAHRRDGAPPAAVGKPAGSKAAATRG